jgi:hypothetical protein
MEEKGEGLEEGLREEGRRGRMSHSERESEGGRWTGETNKFGREKVRGQGRGSRKEETHEGRGRGRVRDDGRGRTYLYQVLAFNFSFVEFASTAIGHRFVPNGRLLPIVRSCITRTQTPSSYGSNTLIRTRVCQDTLLPERDSDR